MNFSLLYETTSELQLLSRSHMFALGMLALQSGAQLRISEKII